MGNTWTRASPLKLESIQSTWLEQVETHSRKEGKLVTFTEERTDVGDEKPINMYSVHCISDNSSKDALPIIMVHGYGAGSLLFTENMANLAWKTKRPVIAVDWFGSGGSDRTKFTPEDVDETIDHFNSFFDKWTIRRSIPHFDLIGHSMGSYFSAHYAIKQGKGKVNKLVLASPAGVPREAIVDWNKKSFLMRTLAKWWENGMTPGHLVRYCGPLGSGLVNRVVKIRFGGDATLGLKFLKDASPRNSSLPVRYLHQITAIESNGEHALSKVLLPGAFARKPLIDDIHKLDSVQGLLFVYGTRDWMDYRAGMAAKKLAKVKTEVVVVPGTHHVYLDESTEFDKVVFNFLEDSESKLEISL